MQPPSVGRRTIGGGIEAAGRVDPALLALLVLALVLRLVGLTTQPLWYDETTLLAYVQLGLGEWLSLVAAADNWAAYLAKAPLVVVGLWGWSQLAGASEVALRLPFALLGAAAVVPLYLIGRRLLGRRVALLAAGLLAVNPFPIYFSQQISEYGVLLLLGLVSIQLWLPLALGEPAGRWRSGAVSLVNLAALGVHPLSIFLPGIQLAWELLRRRARGRWPAWQHAIPLLGFALLAHGYLRHGAFVRRALGWVPPFDGDALVRVAREFSHGVLTHAALELEPIPLSLTLLMGLMLALALLGAGALVRRSGERRVLLLLLLWLCLPALCLGLYSLLRASIWMPRYLMLSLPAYLLLAARGAAWLGGRHPARAALVLAPLLALYSDAQWRHHHPLQGTTRDLVADYRRARLPGDGLIVTPGQIRLPLGYYLSGDSSQWLERPGSPESWWLTTKRGRPLSHRGRLFFRWLATRDRVWVVSMSDWPGDTLVAQVHQQLSRQFLMLYTRMYVFSAVDLTLYMRIPGAGPSPRARAGDPGTADGG
jgi:hypothetical protein